MTAEKRLQKTKDLLDLYFSPNSGDKVRAVDALVGDQPFTAKRVARMAKTILEEVD